MVTHEARQMQIPTGPSFVLGLCCVCCSSVSLQYLAGSIALQFKHVHVVVCPPTVVIELNVTSQALNVHLDMAMIRRADETVTEALSLLRCMI